MPSFRTTFTPYSHAKALADGEVGLTTGQLEFVRTEPIIGAYRQMVSELAAGSAIPADEDPVPYRIEPNARSIDALIRYATEQHLLAAPMAVESIFAPGNYPAS